MNKFIEEKLEHNLKAKDLGNILDLSKGTISKILNYYKGLSKDTIRKLSEYFKISLEAFNRPYKPTNEVNRHFKNASLMNTKKDMTKQDNVHFAQPNSKTSPVSQNPPKETSDLVTSITD